MGGLLFSISTGDQPQREMGFPTEEGERGETSSLDMKGGGKGGRGGSGEGQHSPLMEKCRTPEKQSCHGKMCQASLC